MSRSERFTTDSENKRYFPKVDGSISGAGPTVFSQYGTDYFDNSSGHPAFIGRTGRGKTNLLYFYIHNIIKASESFIMMDPKKDGIKKFGRELSEKGYRVFLLDLEDPCKSPTLCNPLEYIRKLWISGDPSERELASQELDSLAEGIMPANREDPFWQLAASEYFTGCVNALLENAPSEQINLASVAKIMESSEKKNGVTTYLTEFYNLLEEDSFAKKNLSTYVTSPNETRLSIHAVATNGMSKFVQSPGIMNMLAFDNLDIYSLDIDKPFAIFIAKPDERRVYDGIAASYMSQLSGHFIKLARDKYNGCLPKRLHIILEELGSLGNSIKALPNLIAAGRSRRIRVALVLQSYSQLEDIYGKSAAVTITENIGLTFAFASSNLDTLKTWSELAGNRTVYKNGYESVEPLITPSQLAQMPAGTALVFGESKYKFVHKFPLYDDVHHSDRTAYYPEVERPDGYGNISLFRIENAVDEYKENKRAALFDFKHERAVSERTLSDEFDLDKTISAIDAIIKKIEDEEEN